MGVLHATLVQVRKAVNCSLVDIPSPGGTVNRVESKRIDVVWFGILARVNWHRGHQLMAVSVGALDVALVRRNRLAQSEAKVKLFWEGEAFVGVSSRRVEALGNPSRPLWNVSEFGDVGGEGRSLAVASELAAKLGLCLPEQAQDGGSKCTLHGAD